MDPAPFAKERLPAMTESVNLHLPRRAWLHRVGATTLALAGALALAPMARAADEAPDALVKRISTDVLATIKADQSIKAGDIDRIMQLVDSKIMPHVDFERMTARAVGPAWNSATGQQKQRLQEEFKTLLVRTYAGALDQVTDQTVVVRPWRGPKDAREVQVRSEITGRGDPVQLDYRLEKTPGQGAGWKITDIGVLGVWLVGSYRNQFAPFITNGGIDGLIDALAARNKRNSGKR